MKKNLSYCAFLFTLLAAGASHKLRSHTESVQETVNMLSQSKSLPKAPAKSVVAASNGLMAEAVEASNGVDSSQSASGWQPFSAALSALFTQ